MDIQTRYMVNSPSVVYETIDGETILMNLANGFYFSFDGIGAVIWELLMQRANLKEIAGLLQDTARDIPVHMQENINAFILQLTENDLVIPDTESCFRLYSDGANKCIAEPGRTTERPSQTL